MSRGLEFELGEGIILLVLVLYLLKKAKDTAKDAFDFATSHLPGTPEGTLIGPAKWVGNGQPLTPREAQGISVLMGQENNYTLSPDRFQIWFFNGDFYDNRDGLIRDVEGNVIAPAINRDGTANSSAVDALVSMNN